MAQKVHIVLEDDLDGSPATETVSFGLDGKTYEIDLNDKNAGKLRDALAQYVGAGRSVGGARRRGPKSTSSATHHGPSAREVRGGPGGGSCRPGALCSLSADLVGAAAGTRTLCVGL